MTEIKAGSTKANGREPKSCLGQVFIFKLGCFDMCTIAWPIQVWPSLQWKTRPGFRPVSLRFSMIKVNHGLVSGANLIKLLRCKFNHSFFKLGLYIAIQQNLHMFMEQSSLQKSLNIFMPKWFYQIKPID